MPNRVCFFSLYVVAALVPFARGQSSNGYVVGGGGSLNSKFVSHAAIGGEKVFSKGIGVGAELGAVAGHSSFAAISFNGYYHIPNSTTDRQFDPFITGGYSALANILSSGNAGNAGAGLNYWFHRHFGLRAEFRDIVGSRNHVPLFRGGIAFR